MTNELGKEEILVLRENLAYYLDTDIDNVEHIGGYEFSYRSSDDEDEDGVYYKAYPDYETARRDAIAYEMDNIELDSIDPTVLSQCMIESDETDFYKKYAIGKVSEKIKEQKDNDILEQEMEGYECKTEMSMRMHYWKR